MDSPRRWPPDDSDDEPTRPMSAHALPVHRRGTVCSDYNIHRWTKARVHNLQQEIGEPLSHLTKHFRGRASSRRGKQLDETPPVLQTNTAKMLISADLVVCMCVMRARSEV